MVILMGTFFKYIDIASEKSGKVISLFVLALMFIVVIGVFNRYVLHISFIWGLPLSRQIFGVFILFAGAYAMLTNRHLRVEVLYNRFSPRVSFYARLFDLLAFIFVMGIIIWQTGRIGLSSLALQELTQGTPKIPLYTIKSFIPLVSILLLLQGISSFFRKKEPGEMLEVDS